jgi:hypothetical protein
MENPDRCIELTEQIKRHRASTLDGATFTSRAEPFLTALSLQSRKLENRHAWIEADDKLTLHVQIDLEDMDLEDIEYEGKWDNAVARIVLSDFGSASEVLIEKAVQSWFSGSTVHQISELLKGTDCVINFARPISTN